MTAEQNVASVKRFFHGVDTGQLDDVGDLLADDVVWWSPNLETTKAKLLAGLAQLEALKDGPGVMTIRSITAQDNRVAVEADGVITLKDGWVHSNTYFFLFVVEGGKFSLVREHLDTARLKALFGSEGLVDLGH